MISSLLNVNGDESSLVDLVDLVVLRMSDSIVLNEEAVIDELNSSLELNGGVSVVLEYSGSLLFVASLLVRLVISVQRILLDRVVPAENSFVRVVSWLVRALNS